MFLVADPATDGRVRGTGNTSRECSRNISGGVDQAHERPTRRVVDDTDRGRIDHYSLKEVKVYSQGIGNDRFDDVAVTDNEYNSLIYRIVVGSKNPAADRVDGAELCISHRLAIGKRHTGRMTLHDCPERIFREAFEVLASPIAVVTFDETLVPYQSLRRRQFSANHLRSLHGSGEGARYEMRDWNILQELSGMARLFNPSAVEMDIW